MRLTTMQKMFKYLIISLIIISCIVPISAAQPEQEYKLDKKTEDKIVEDAIKTSETTVNENSVISVVK